MDTQNHTTLVAYFSMEMMLETDIPSYAGGLGILAGDLLRSCADMSVPVVGVSLVYSGNIWGQSINPDGTQDFREKDWQKLDQLTKLPQHIELTLMGTKINVGCWRYDIVGLTGFVVPVYLLDTESLENQPWVREITRNLYDNRWEYRLCQEAVLGFGGVKMLRELGFNSIKTFHLNEGHAAFVPLALLSENEYRDDRVRELCVFTTHTPMPEGHDKFSYEMAYKYLDKYLPWHIKKLAGESELSMTHLALNMSRYSFGVSEKHKVTSRALFPGYDIDSITNGVHLNSWISSHSQDFYTYQLGNWQSDPLLLLKAVEKLPFDSLWSVHQENKRELVSYVNQRLTAVSSLDERLHPRMEDMFDSDTLTISLARRPVPYKRPLLLYHDLEQLARIGAGRLQIIQCGRTHPNDKLSQGFVRDIVSFSQKLRAVLKITFLEDYSPKITRLLVAGSDLWLNTPRRFLEASGTSGMKAAANGCLNFSVLDGWWIEGYRDCPQAGFALGPADRLESDEAEDLADAKDLYAKLQNEIIPLYYDHRTEWISRMKYAISLSAQFNTHRCIKEYLAKAWRV